MNLRISRHLALSSCLLLLVSCASTQTANKTAQVYFDEGEAAYRTGHYEDAITQYKKVKETYSSPELTTRAELKIADAHYDSKAYIEAAAAYEDFRKLHPTNERAGYALYRLCLSHYHQIAGIDTDQTPVKNTVATMENFLSRYPDSDYSEEIRQKLAECRVKQLQYENYVGNFYLRTDRLPSAIKRLSEALAKFPGSPKLDETLFYLGKAYLKSGEKGQAAVTFRRLAKEFPASPLLLDATKLMGGFASYSSARG